MKTIPSSNPGVALALCIMSLSAWAGPVTVEHAADAATISNGNLRVTFDTTRGTWCADALSDGTKLIAGAVSRVNDWSSAAPGASHQVESLETRDKLGTGRTLMVRSSVPGQPVLHLGITLYEDATCIVLGGGVRNVLNNEIRVMEFSPLSAARLFPDAREMKDPKTLGGVAGSGGNAVQGLTCNSPNNLLLTFTDGTRRWSMVAGGLTYHDFAKWADIAADAAGKPSLTANAKDQVGRRVTPGETYLPDDLFYIDLLTPDPFLALEQYGLAVRERQNARPNIYDFPTVCAWYVQEKTKGARINNTAGLVGEMDEVVKTGFLKYSPVALRLVPDSYGDITEQGWWDDEHWQKFGHYTKPYETSEKWCQAIRERGGLPFTYVQTGFVSHDYGKAFPGHILSNDISTLTQWHGVAYDYTDPEFQAHMKAVWGGLGRAGLAGVMFDYPETGWRHDGGFEDKKATTASAYRKIFELAREGLGPNGYLHERILGESAKEKSPPTPLVDVSVGLVDSQRVEGDTVDFHPGMVKRCALRWYKTRTLYTYDMDSKTFFEPREGQRPPLPAVRRQSILTMLYVTAGRVLLADSFRTLTPEMLLDMSRIYPIHRQPRSARPVDAFTPAGGNCPRVFDFAVNPDWHQLTLFNPDFKNKATIPVALSGEAVDGALGLDPQAEYYAYDFWNDRFLGRFKGSQMLEQELAASESRMISLHRVETNPQFISTNRHVMQGYVDLIDKPNWNGETKTLSGTSKVIGGETYKVVVACNGLKPAAASAANATARIESLAGTDDLAVLAIASQTNADAKWEIRFK
ncbi:MAG: hypothetical protein NTW21_01000 [Verrucomicrobia bacterium]|nr:hypothetical protein [Verrucomicrobiota bacterium]